MSARFNSSAERRPGAGFSVVELTLVCAIMGVMMVIAIPQLSSARRAMRASAIPVEVKSQLRYARQLAMSRQRAITFQYKTNERRIKIIQHNLDYVIAGGTTKVGTPVLSDAAYPMTTGATVVRTVELATGGAAAADISYGRPAAITTANLDDSTTLTPAVGNQVNVTFQPDGAVIDASGSTANFALMFYHPGHPESTATAVSILGAAGRIKIWRYSNDAQNFVE